MLGYSDLFMAVRAGNADAVNAFIGSGTDVNARSDSFTALHLAAVFGHTNIVRALITAKADINAVNSGGWTALHMASEKGHSDTVRTLIIAGANIHIRSSSGSTALHYAAQHGFIDIVHMLVASGVDITITNIMGFTAYNLAIEYEHENVQLTRLNPNFDIEISELMQKWHRLLIALKNASIIAEYDLRTYCYLAYIAYEQRKFSLLDDLLKDEKIVSYFYKKANLTKEQLPIHKYALRPDVERIHVIGDRYDITPFVMLEMAKWLPSYDEGDDLALLRNFEARTLSFRRVRDSRNSATSIHVQKDVAAPACRPTNRD